MSVALDNRGERSSNATSYRRARIKQNGRRDEAR